MTWLFDFLELNQGTITAIATIVIAFSAIITAVATKTLARENRLLRKAGTEPKVVAYLIIHPLYQTILNFVLANVGQGPARNISFKFNADETDLDIHGVALRNSTDREVLGFLPQGESIQVFFGSGLDLYKEPKLKPFEVAVEYDDMDGKHHIERCPIDIAQFDGFTSLGKPPEREVADSLKKIEGHLKHVVTELKKR